MKVSLITAASVMVWFLLVIASYNKAQGNSGALIMVVYGLVIVTLYYLAGRALVTGHRKHWAFHASAVVLTLLPLLLLLQVSCAGTG